MAVELSAYQFAPSTSGWTIEPAPVRREWMDQTLHKSANRCLPLTIANQAGWIVRLPVRFKAVWDGKPEPAGTTLTFPEHEDIYRGQILKNFGSGIVSFAFPWLFRTSPGYGLWVRGPANFFRPDVHALEGLVESDWAPYSFTMNWKILKPRADIWFRAGDPICMLVPYPLELLEQVQPRYVSIESNPMLMEDFGIWWHNRQQQHREKPDPTVEAPTFRLDYMRGRMPDGVRAPAHRTGFDLAQFADERIRK